MYGPKEELLKKMAAQECGGLRESPDYAECGTTAARQSLTERIAAQRFRVMRECQHSERLAELQMLLEKNPDVARILDLLECVGGQHFAGE